MKKINKIGEYIERNSCRFCEGENLSEILYFGNVPLAGGFLRKTDIKTQIPSAKKFFKRTNWKPDVSLKKSLEKFLNEIRSSS